MKFFLTHSWQKHILQVFSFRKNIAVFLTYKKGLILLLWEKLWKVLGSVARIQCWRPLVAGRQFIVVLSWIGACVRVDGVKSTTVHHVCWIPMRVCATSTRLLHSWKEQDQQFTFCGRFGTACIFSTGSPICAWSVFCCMQPSRNEN